MTASKKTELVSAIAFIHLIYVFYGHVPVHKSIYLLAIEILDFSHTLERFVSLRSSHCHNFPHI